MSDKSYKIWNCQERKWESSGRSLYGKKRSVWANKSGAWNTLKQMPPALRAVCIVREFQMVETPESLKEWTKLQGEFE